jgi:hypothetical protein
METCQPSSTKRCHDCEDLTLSDSQQPSAIFARQLQASIGYPRPLPNLLIISVGLTLASFNRAILGTLAPNSWRIALVASVSLSSPQVRWYRLAALSAYAPAEPHQEGEERGKYALCSRPMMPSLTSILGKMVRDGPAEHEHKCLARPLQQTEGDHAHQQPDPFA